MGDKKLFKRTLISVAFILSFAAAGTASAVDWLMLQGTEPAAASPPVKVWGFIQTDYQKDFSKANASGQYITPKLLGPNLNAQSGFNISRLRFGARGTGFPIDDHINYFVLAEFGNNAVTANSTGTTFAKLTDASITLNYIKGARIRTGLFKYPGSEEGLQSFMATDYIDFSEVANGLLLERFPNKAYTPCTPSTITVCAPGNNGNVGPYTQAQFQNGSNFNTFTAPVGAFRDTGIQMFDSFDMGKDWALTYAVMVGNGNGIQFDNSDGKYDNYLYLATEKNLGGTGPGANGLKFYVWNQSGQRLLDNTPCAVPANCNAADYNPKLYDRKRSGLGVKYLVKP